MGSREPGQSISWDEYVEWLVAEHGTLAAAAQRLAAQRGWTEDALSIERALRRLRARGARDGGTWGARALATFGLPGAVEARVRWMGAYHSRFTDMPLPLCRDLLQLWDRPPVNEALAAAAWLAIAHATCALRANDRDRARLHLRRAHAARAHAPVEAQIELLLCEAFIASREDPDAVAALLAEAEPLLGQPMPDDDRACLCARWIDHRAYALNRAGDHRGAEALYASLPDQGAPSFARSRRANGLAYARLQLGTGEEAAALAREAAAHAGDGGHLRLRAMALRMLSRALGDTLGQDALARAQAIAASLDEPALRLRFA